MLFPFEERHVGPKFSLVSVFHILLSMILNFISNAISSLSPSGRECGPIKVLEAQRKNSKVVDQPYSSAEP